MKLNVINIEKNTKLYRYQFNRINELLDYVEKTDYNHNIFDQNALFSDAKDGFTVSSCDGVQSLKDAIDLCRYGVDVNQIDNFIRLNKIVRQILPEFSQNRNIEHNVYGFRPDIVKYLRGNPRSMYKLVRNQNRKNINVLFSPIIMGLTNKNSINNLGVCVIQTVNLLQTVGYDVACFYVDASIVTEKSVSKEMLLMEIPINGSSEPLNPKVSYFPLCHPAFSRRILFRLVECAPLCLSGWKNSYGKDMDINQYYDYIACKNEHDKQIVIDRSIWNIIKGNDILKDFENFLKFVDIESYLTLEQKEDYHRKVKKLKNIR